MTAAFGRLSFWLMSSMIGKNDVLQVRSYEKKTAGFSPAEEGLLCFVNKQDNNAYDPITVEVFI